MSMGQPLKMPINLISYRSTCNSHCLVAHMAQCPLARRDVPKVTKAGCEFGSSRL